MKRVMRRKIDDGTKHCGLATYAAIYKHLLLKVTGSYHGSVTTDELVPSGEASSFRSNPEKISEYTMISRDPEYVSRTKAVRSLEYERREQVCELRTDDARI
ncbi:MAG: hypothetical protein ACLUD2_06345 [Clostridium sp.]